MLLPRPIPRFKPQQPLKEQPLTDIKAVVPAWKGIDAVLTTGSSLFLVNKDLVARAIVPNAAPVGNLAFDGRYLWAADGDGRGISVYKEPGRLVTKVTAAHNLPTSSFPMEIVALDEGRLIASGSIGGFSGRGWIAMIELQEVLPRVKVIHEAIEAPEDYFKERDNPRLRFNPEWIVKHTDEEGRHWVFVGRNRLSPLLVDVKNELAAVYGGARVFPRSEGPATAFLSLAGKLYVAGSHSGFKSLHLEGEGRNLIQEAHHGEETNWHSGNAHGGSMERHGDWLSSAFVRSVGGGKRVSCSAFSSFVAEVAAWRRSAAGALFSKALGKGMAPNSCNLRLPSEAPLPRWTKRGRRTG